MDWFVLDVAEDMEGVVTLLQNIKTEQLIAKRPEEDINSNRYIELNKLYKEQPTDIDDVEDESDDDAGTPPGGGGIGGGRGGGGGGGGGRGGGGGIGGGRGGGDGSGGGRQ